MGKSKYFKTKSKIGKSKYFKTKSSICRGGRSDLLLLQLVVDLSSLSPLPSNFVILSKRPFQDFFFSTFDFDQVAKSIDIARKNA